jgi:malonyl CoA-acyl carrier protein transacylase
MRIYIFPGQGSQQIGMGAELFDSAPDELAAADAVLGWSVRDLCLNDPDRRLNNTAWTQPAMYVVNALAYLEKARDPDGHPELVAGHSLGEYSALFAAGAFDFVTGLRLVQRRGELMGQVGGGGMAAVIGLSSQRVEEVLRRSGLESIDLANINGPDQCVLAGPGADLDRAEPLFRDAGAQHFKRLPVSAPFHSRYMAAVAKEFESFLEEFVLSSPRIPVVSNVEARPYPAGQLKRLLVKQITSPVQWQKSVEYLLQRDGNIEEVGPGRVLTALVAKVRRVRES